MLPVDVPTTVDDPAIVDMILLLNVTDLIVLNPYSEINMLLYKSPHIPIGFNIDNDVAAAGPAE